MGDVQGSLLVGKQEDLHSEKEKLMNLSGSHVPLPQCSSSLELK